MLTLHVNYNPITAPFTIRKIRGVGIVWFQVKQPRVLLIYFALSAQKISLSASDFRWSSCFTCSYAPSKNWITTWELRKKNVVTYSIYWYLNTKVYTRTDNQVSGSTYYLVVRSPRLPSRHVIYLTSKTTSRNYLSMRSFF